MILSRLLKPEYLELLWGIAEYSTPEKFMGKKFSNAVYKRSPEESYARILKHFRKILPDADTKAIERILK